MISRLLEAGASPDVKGEYRETPLIIAARGGHTAAVKVLLDGGAAIDAKSDGWSPLFWAAREGYHEIVTLLMQRGAKLPAKGKLIAAIAAGDNSAVTELLDRGSDIEIKDSTGNWPALTWCALLGREQALEALLAHGVSLKGEQPGTSALVQASRLGRTAIVKKLVSSGALARDAAHAGEALMEASKNGHGGVVNELLSHGVSPGYRSPRGRTILIAAAENGHMEVVKALVEHGADVKAATPLGLTAADEAAIKEHREVAAYLREQGQHRMLETKAPVKNEPPTAKTRATQQGTPAPGKKEKSPPCEESLNRSLLDAVEEGNLPKVHELLAQGASAGARDPRDRPAGAIAAQAHRTDILKSLLDAGADSTAIMASIGYGDHMGEAVKLLIERGGDLNTPSLHGLTPLMLAAMAGSTMMVDLLLKAGARVNDKGQGGTMALLQACGRGHEEIAIALLQAGAAPDASSHHSTALGLAAQNRLPSAVRLILKGLYGSSDRKGGIFRLIADGDAPGIKAALAAGTKTDAAEPLTKWPPLLWASLLGEKGCAQVLIDCGADVNVAKNGWRPLAFACLSKNQALTEMLLAAGASPDIPAGPDSNRLLPTLASQGELALISMLIEKGAPVDTSVQQATSLHIAAQQGNREMIKLLCDKGAHVDARNINKATPLVLAFQYGQADAAAELFERGAKADAKLNDRPLLCWMAELDRNDSVCLLISKGASLKAADKEGMTPLHCAAAAGAEESLKALIDAGADQKALSKRGTTPLMEAATSGVPGIIRILLQQKADPLRAGKEGRTALDMAAVEGEKEAVVLLYEAQGGKGGTRADLWHAIAEDDGDKISSAAYGKDLCGISPLVTAVRCGALNAARAILALEPPAPELSAAREEAEQYGDKEMQVLIGAAAVKKVEKTGIRAQTIDLVMKDFPALELPIILDGEWSRYAEAPDSQVEQVTLRHQWTNPFFIIPLLKDMDEAMKRAGFTVQGNLVCERLRDIVLRCYSKPGTSLFSVWNLGLMEQSVDMITRFTDGREFTTTMADKKEDTSLAGNTTRYMPDIPLPVLFHKHQSWITRFVERGQAGEKCPGDLVSIARRLDSYLVKRFGCPGGK